MPVYDVNPRRTAPRAPAAAATDGRDGGSGRPGRTLVVCFSRTGHTRLLAREIASQCGGDFEEITDRIGRGGVLGTLRSVIEAVLHLSAPIRPTRHPPRAYDMVIIGTPVWAAQMASPVRSYLLQHRGEFNRVAFFCTTGGRANTSVPAAMARLCGRTAVAEVALSTDDIAGRRHWTPIARFVRIVKAARGGSSSRWRTPGAAA